VCIGIRDRAVVCRGGTGAIAMRMFRCFEDAVGGDNGSRARSNQINGRRPSLLGSFSQPGKRFDA